ncbi:response regulator transcription factor [Amycolatopsis roodepoortensis]|uniref:DNA-binding NarL/FixJ family response regulator n=1 Tax=Amycolatopsis roodepoortensis TaxID=700274 RepID=A0ABR9L3C3_9PSEU|nr:MULTISPECIES: LuxR C-terminal-related transcriptional regulator [Amycolatopsis]MBE1575030.1 DNA-binding NarL/FixJ family response regulator [Amycolatopsis roodepoortensis]GHG97408.1 hypothetical protein GCM10017788_76890 [Amycolatopsis acidiphila]
MALNRIAAAYLIRHNARTAVHELFGAARLNVTADEVGPTQIPRYLVSASTPKVPAAPGLLTPRELQILLLIAAGLENPEIARSLHVSVDTVKTHARSLFRKLGARGRANAVHIAHQRGIMGGE